MVLSLLLAGTLMAGKGPTTLVFSCGEQSAWQRVSANGQILEPVANTPIEQTPGCYGMGRFDDGTIWAATEHHFYTLDAALKTRRGGTVAVETIAGQSARHLYRIIRGKKMPLAPPANEFAAVLEEIDPSTWAITRAWSLPGYYSTYGLGHVAVDPQESIAYYAKASEQNGTIHRHDLATDEPLLELVARPVGSGGLIVLPDGSIVVGYTDGVQRFEPDGTHRRTYPAGAIRPGQGLVTAGADGSTFWVQGYADGTAYSTLFEFALDGTLRHEWNTPANGVRWDQPFVDPPAAVQASILVFSGLEQTPWQKVGTDGSLLGDFPNTPVDPFAPGCFGMGVLSNGRIAIWAEAYLWTINRDGSDLQGGTIDDLFIGGFSRTHAYKIQPYPTTPSPVHIIEVDPDTMTVARTWELGANSTMSSYGFGHIAVNADRTVAYYSRNQDVNSPFAAEHYGVIHRWDLTNDVALSDLVSRPASTSGGLIVLPDDTIVVGYTDGVRRYAADGTLLNTYAYNARPGQGMVAIGRGSDSVWIQSTGVDYSAMHEVESGSGTLLNGFELPSNGVSWDGPFVFLEGTVACPDPCEKAGHDVPYFALSAESNTVLFYDRAFTLVNSFSAPKCCALAPSSEGIWVCLDDDVGGTSLLFLVDPSSVDEGTDEALILRGPIPTEVRIAELAGSHALFVLSCDRLLTSDRTTHELISICLPAAPEEEGGDEGTALVDQRFSLVVNPLDAQLIDGGKNLLYVDAGVAKIFNLKNDADLRTVGTVGGIWPTLLNDNTFLVYTGAFRSGGGDVLRYTRTGTLKRRYPVEIPSIFSAGLYGMAADLQTDACSCGNPKEGKILLPGEENPAVIPVSLLDGEQEPYVILDDVVQGGIDTAAAFTVLGVPDGSGFSDQGGSNANRPQPNRHCGPEAGISSVAPNPGCNAGGKGWTPSYTGASGSVPTATDPSGEETLTGKDTIFIRAKLRHADYPSGDEEVLCYAKVDLKADPSALGLHPHAEPRVLSIGDDDRGLSDGQGNMVSGSTLIQFMDGDGRPFGRRLVSPTRKYWTRSELILEAISDVGLDAGATPRRIGTGLVYGEDYGGPLVFGLTAVDPLFIEGGSFGPDKKVPQWTYPLAYYTEAPKDLAQIHMPIIYGEVSDEGAVSPVTGLPNSRGKCPVRYVGPDVLGTAPGGETWGRFNISLFALYKVVALYGSDCGGLGLYGKAAVVSTIETSDGSEDDDTEPATTEASVVALDGSPDLSQLATDGTMQIVLFTTSGRTESVVIAADNFAKTVTIETPIDPATASGVAWYLSSIDYVPRRVKIDLATRNGVDVQVPTWSGFIKSTPYQDFTSTDGDYRVADMWAIGAILAAHLDGEVTMAVNVIGIEDQGDGSGLPITEYFTAFNHFLDNCVHVQRQKPSGAGGLWPQLEAELPLFSDGFSKTKSSSFADAQARTVRTLGGQGLQVNAYFADGISMRDALQLWIENGACKAGTDEYGRTYVFVLDRYSDTSSWKYIRHQNNVFADPPHRTRALDEAFNSYKGGCDWDPEGQQFREDDLKQVSPAAIVRNKGFVRPSKHVDLKLLAYKDQAEWVLGQALLVNQDGPQYVVIQGLDPGILDTRIGTGFFFSSPMLPGEDDDGMVDRPLVILHRTLDIDTGLSNVIALDVGDLLVPSSRRMIATDIDAIAPVATDDDALAPVAA